MKCSLGISNFLEETASLSHSIVFPYFFALIIILALALPDITSVPVFLMDSAFLSIQVFSNQKSQPGRSEPHTQLEMEPRLMKLQCRAFRARRAEGLRLIFEECQHSMDEIQKGKQNENQYSLRSALMPK